MASYKRFEDVPVWNAAVQLASDVFSLTARPAFKFRGDLVNQIRRASLSVSNNIAEGFERGTTADLINFLYIARGSCGESRSMLRFAGRLDGMADEASALERTANVCVNVSSQLWGWIDSLKNSTIAGDRHLTDRSRAGYVRAASAGELRERFGPAAANQALEEGRYQTFLQERFEAMAKAAHPERELVVEEKCPTCGGGMVKRHDRNGRPFLGCLKYPTCTGSRPWVARGGVR